MYKSTTITDNNRIHTHTSQIRVLRPVKYGQNSPPNWAEWAVCVQ